MRAVLSLLFLMSFTEACRDRSLSDLDESAGKPVPDDNNTIDVYTLGDGTSNDEIRSGECDHQLQNGQPFKGGTLKINFHERSRRVQLAFVRSTAGVVTISFDWICGIDLEGSATKIISESGKLVHTQSLYSLVRERAESFRGVYVFRKPPAAEFDVPLKAGKYTLIVEAGVSKHSRQDVDDLWFAGVRLKSDGQPLTLLELR